MKINDNNYVIYRHWKGKFGGHVSIEIQDEKLGCFYLSLWPARSGPGAVKSFFDRRPVAMRPIEYDTKKSDGIKSAICLYSLNTSAMIDKAKLLSPGRVRWTLISGGISDFDNPMSCCTFVKKMLVAGGLYDLLFNNRPASRPSFLRGMAIAHAAQNNPGDYHKFQTQQEIELKCDKSNFFTVYDTTDGLSHLLYSAKARECFLHKEAIKSITQPIDQYYNGAAIENYLTPGFFSEDNAISTGEKLDSHFSWCSIT